jgi:ABC-type Zn uptake system ZnuABC Zn-binding protein ZnuA
MDLNLVNKKRNLFLFLILFLGIGSGTACGGQADRPSGTAKLRLVATTTIVGDVVGQVAGDLVQLDVLLPVGADPHSFDPTPQDVAKIAEADLIFANGAGLEVFLDDLIESAGAQDRVFSVSEGIDFLAFEGEDKHDQEEDEHENHEHTGVDPHTWTDPNNVMVWVRNITAVLVERDPQNGAIYEANAEKYQAELIDLDAWIRGEVAKIPEQARKLVTDHTLFSYFADEYGFDQVGALIPGYSTLSEPTAQDLAAIEDAIQTLGVKAVFVGNTVNPSLAQRVAADTGIQLISVYTGSLSDAGGEAGTYLDYMRYNTMAFVSALK